MADVVNIGDTIVCAMPADEIMFTHDITEQTSPEHPSLSRRRPLRTYGKRKPSDIEPETQRKRQKLFERLPLTDTRESESPKPASPPPLPEAILKSSLKRSGIMRYFKPMPSNSTASSSIPASEISTSPIRSDEAIEPPSTPPSSPPKFRQRIKRRLTTRPVSATAEMAASIDNPKTPEDKRQPSPSSDASPKMEDRGALQAASVHSLNRQKLVDGQQKGVKGREKGVKSPPIQTTLSLSANPGFTECRVCDTVYNTHNQKDIKYHARRHASAAFQKPQRAS